MIKPSLTAHRGQIYINVYSEKIDPLRSAQDADFTSKPVATYFTDATLNPEEPYDWMLSELRFQDVGISMAELKRILGLCGITVELTAKKNEGKNSGGKKKLDGCECRDCTGNIHHDSCLCNYCAKQKSSLADLLRNP